MSQTLTLALTTCDRCPATARTQYLLPTGRDLVLCGHHSYIHGTALEPAATAIPLETTR